MSSLHNFGICRICHMQFKTRNFYGDHETRRVQNQTKTFTSACASCLRYCIGFAHGLVLFQVIDQVCKYPSHFRFDKQPFASASSCTSTKGIVMQGSVCDNLSSDELVKREPNDKQCVEDDQSDLKVFFEKHSSSENRVLQCQTNTTVFEDFHSLNKSKSGQNACVDYSEKIHTPKHEDLLRCSFCDATFLRGASQDCVQHLCEAHPEEKHFYCDICGAVFKKKGFVSRHKRRVHKQCNTEEEETKFGCEVRSKVHRQCTTKVEEIQFACEVCNKTFASKDHQEDHCRRVHSLSAVGSCIFNSVESEVSKTSVNLNRHKKTRCNLRKNVRIKKRIQCHHCQREFASEKSLEHHTRLAHPKPASYKCVPCGLSFRFNTKLKQHQNSKHHIKSSSDAQKAFSCDECSKEYPSRNALLHHIRFTHTKQASSQCRVCWKTFKSMPLAREHMRTVHKVRVVSESERMFLRCTFCSETFPEGAKERVANHLSEFHSKELASSLSCGLCGNKFRRKFTLNYHLRNTHSLVNGEEKLKLQKEKMHPCEKCGKTLSKNSLRRHCLMFHSKHSPTECKVCGKKLQSALHLERHMRCHSDRPQRVCHICGVHFKSDQGLKSHLAAHKGVKSHTCEICGAGFVRRTSWQRHIRQHSDTIFQCTVCSKDFVTDYALHTHMLSRHQKGVYFNNRLKTIQELGYTPDMIAVYRHINNQCVLCSQPLENGICPTHPSDSMLVFHCAKCEMKFKHIEAFCHHLKSHNTGKFPATLASSCRKNYTVGSTTTESGEAVMTYACKICHKTFQRKEYVSHHMRQHREKSFSCPVCEKKFTYKCNMKNHLLTHSSEKPFKCHVCGKGFKRQSLLKTHAHVHDPPFRCHICKKGLTRKQYLTQHYRLVHPEVQVIPVV